MVELELAKEYALRVKDMTAAEQANAIAAEHEREMKAQRTMLAEFQKESDSLLLERDRQMQQAHEKHQVSLWLHASRGLWTVGYQPTVARCKVLPRAKSMLVLSVAIMVRS